MFYASHVITTKQKPTYRRDKDKRSKVYNTMEND